MIFCISASWSWPKPFSASPCSSFLRVSGALQRARSSASFLKNSGSLPKSSSMNCCADMGVPSGCQKVVHHHVLDGALLAVGEFHFDLSGGARSFGAGVAASAAAWRLPGRLADLCFGFRLERLAVPFRIVEVVVRLHEVVDREVILAVVEPGAAADDLLELDHRIDRAHQDDVADVAGIHAGGELLRSGQDGRDGLFVVLKIAQVLLAQLAVVGRDALAIVRVLAGLHLVDEVAHGQGVGLRGAEDQRLFVLVDLLHEQLHAVRLRAP